MRIGYFADGPWAHNAFNKIFSDPTFEIAFICIRFDAPDPVLRNYAQINGIDCLADRNINSIEFLQKVATYDCEIFVSMSFNQIFKDQIRFLAPKGIINCHAGKLPFYRGRNILNWVLINDEKEFGITTHFVDRGIDTGDIITQECYQISDDDDYGSLLRLAHEKCPEVLISALKKIQSGNDTITKQSDIHPVGLYCTQRRPGDEIINWDLTSRELFCFIRGISAPGPQATGFIRGEKIKINRAKIVANAPLYKCINGAVVGKTENSLMIKTADSTLEILEYTYEGKVKIGDRISRTDSSNGK